MAWLESLDMASQVGIILGLMFLAAMLAVAMAYAIRQCYHLWQSHRSTIIPHRTTLPSQSKLLRQSHADMSDLDTHRVDMALELTPVLPQLSGDLALQPPIKTPSTGQTRLIINSASLDKTYPPAIVPYNNNNKNNNHSFSNSSSNGTEVSRLQSPSIFITTTDLAQPSLATTKSPTPSDLPSPTEWKQQLGRRVTLTPAKLNEQVHAPRRTTTKQTSFSNAATLHPSVSSRILSRNTTSTDDSLPSIETANRSKISDKAVSLGDSPLDPHPPMLDTQLPAPFFRIPTSTTRDSQNKTATLFSPSSTDTVHFSDYRVISYPGFLNMHFEGLQLTDLVATGGSAYVFSSTMTIDNPPEAVAQRMKGFDQVAVKILIKPDLVDEHEFVNSFRQEVSILYALSDAENVIQLIAFCESPFAMYFIMIPVWIIA